MKFGFNNRLVLGQILIERMIPPLCAGEDTKRKIAENLLIAGIKMINPCGQLAVVRPVATDVKSRAVQHTVALDIADFLGHVIIQIGNTHALASE